MKGEWIALLGAIVGSLITILPNWIKDKRKLIKLKNAFWEEVESYQSEISQVTCDLVDEYLNPTRTRVTCGPNSSGHSYINALKVELGVELPQPIRQLTRHIEDRTKIICTGIAKRNEQAIDSKNKELKQRVSSKPFTNPTYSQQRTATAIVECCKLLHELMKALETKERFTFKSEVNLSEKVTSILEHLKPDLSKSEINSILNRRPH